MAKLTGGILGTVAGKASGLVFSFARAREGKVNTVRALVIPSNPNTADQQSQRNAFSQALVRVKLISPDIYSADLNRAVNQLPGFQSLMSVILRNRDAVDPSLFEAFPSISLGDLHYPGNVTWTPADDNITVTWSLELGSNGTADDEIVAFIYSSDTADPVVVYTSIDIKKRSEGAVGIEFDGLDSGKEFICCIYLRGASTAEGNLTKITSAAVETTTP
jgi:hypothetical protein